LPCLNIRWTASIPMRARGTGPRGPTASQGRQTSPRGTSLPTGGMCVLLQLIAWLLRILTFWPGMISPGLSWVFLGVPGPSWMSWVRLLSWAVLCSPGLSVAVLGSPTRSWLRVLAHRQISHVHKWQSVCDTFNIIQALITASGMHETMLRFPS
jgi:hypothetical protein